MSNQESWVQRLSAHCSVRGFSKPIFQDVSDRRGGRTAWSTIANINGMTYPARFYYDGEYMAQAKEDAAEVALRNLTGTMSVGTVPPPASFYAKSGQGQRV